MQPETHATRAASSPIPRQPLPHVPPIKGRLLAHTVFTSLVAEQPYPDSVSAKNSAGVYSELLPTHCASELPAEPPLLEPPSSPSLLQPKDESAAVVVTTTSIKKRRIRHLL